MKLRSGILAILGVATVTAVSIGVMSGLVLRAHRAALLAQLDQGADQLSETIGSSTFYDMLENRRDAVRAREQWFQEAKWSVEARQELAGERQHTELARWQAAARRATRSLAMSWTSLRLTRWPMSCSSSAF